MTVEVSGTVTGTTEVRTRGGEEYYVDHYDVVETHTANGVTATYTESSIAKDLKVTDPGDTLEIIVLATGNAVLYGPDGTAVARNPGQFRYRLLIDEKAGKELLFDPRVDRALGRLLRRGGAAAAGLDARTYVDPIVAAVRRPGGGGVPRGPGRPGSLGS